MNRAPKHSTVPVGQTAAIAYKYNPTDSIPRLAVTVPQGSTVLSLSEPTVWGLLAPKGPLESITIGKRRLILWESIEKFIESRRGVPGDARRNKTVPALGTTSAKKNGREEPDLTISVRDCGFSTRTRNALLCDGIETLEDLVPKTDRELLLIPNFGRVCLAEIKAALVKRGLREKDAADPQ